MPCLLCYETSLTLLKLRRYGFHVSRYGVQISQVYSPYFRNGWMDCRDSFHAVFLLILLCNGQNIAKYEAYWLMCASIVNPLGMRFTSYFPYFP